ncbi:hypothetical protein FOG50_00699 [Hanseniaspora uvarum]|nr:hypothetical protein FOG50_00699 [Hanseniaspora uvarum]
MTSAASFFKSDTSLAIVRFLQFAVGIIVLGLISYSDSLFNDEKTNFGVAVSTISVFYSIVLPVFLFGLNTYVVPAVVGIFEWILTLLWFCVFVVLAYQYGSGTCPSGFGSITRKCRTGQAAIAFSGVEFFLIYWTAVVFITDVSVPIIKNNSSKLAFFRTSEALGVNLNKIHGVKYTSLAADQETPVEDLEAVSEVSHEASADETKEQAPSSEVV